MMGATKEEEEEERCSSLLTLFVTTSHHPLFSIAATSILIAFLYVPHRTLLTLIFSPALIAAILLLSALIRFGSPQAPQPQTCTTPPPSSSSPTHHQQQKPVVFRSEWERPAEWPLDVIYEEYEGGVDGDSSEYSAVGLRLCFTDSDSESDGSPEILCFRWEEEGEGMIEIELEEDNLIEIDISG